MNEQEKAELEYYRQTYGYAAPAPSPADSFGPPPAAQDALSVDEQAAFWPEDLDYDPKWEINRRHISHASGWRKQGDA